jgi:hypothetical protein
MAIVLTEAPTWNIIVVYFCWENPLYKIVAIFVKHNKYERDALK